jgi:hypothetical protein
MPELALVEIASWDSYGPDATRCFLLQQLQLEFRKRRGGAADDLANDLRQTAAELSQDQPAGFLKKLDAFGGI